MNIKARPYGVNYMPREQDKPLMNMVKDGGVYYVFENCIPDIKEPMEVIRHLNDNGQFNYDNNHIHGRLSINNVPYFSWLHFEFHKMLSKLIPDTKPSYNFLAQYLPGSEMHAHTDRPQCKWNFGLQIHGESEFYIETNKTKPIGNITIEGDTEFQDLRVHSSEPDMILLKPNMGILYSGVDNKHWLPPEPFYRAACVFHFVDKDFTGCLN